MRPTATTPRTGDWPSPCDRSPCPGAQRGCRCGPRERAAPITRKTPRAAPEPTAWDTFDATGCTSLLRRLRARDEEVVHASDSDLDLDLPIAAAIPVHRELPLAITEGDHLLGGRGEGPRVASSLHESWYIDVDDAEVVTASRERADHVWTLTAASVPAPGRLAP